MTETERILILALREAVEALYKCRHSEQPLAKKLDALLKSITGKSEADLAFDWAMAEAKARDEARAHG